jgi:hypothetical protein
MRHTWLAAIVACGGTRPPVQSTAPPLLHSEPAGVAPIRLKPLTVGSLDEYCAALAKHPPVEDLQPGCLAGAAWSDVNGKASDRFTPGGAFEEARVVAVITSRGAYACVLAIRASSRWFVGEHPIGQCKGSAYSNDPEGGPRFDGSMKLDRGALLIFSGSHDIACDGCEDPIHVYTGLLAICTSDANGARCTPPIELEHQGVDNRFRTWSFDGKVLELGPWMLGDASDPGPHEVFDGDGGGPAERHPL